MSKKYKYKETNFKCPECNSRCAYNIDLDLFVCLRPLVNARGQVKGSCGKFYENGVRFK